MQKLFKKCVFLAMSAFMVMGSVYGSEISVTPLISYMSPSQKVQDIKVMNQGNEKAYVKATLFENINPGVKGKAKRIPIIPNAHEQAPLIITPTHLVIPPGESRMIRVVSYRTPLEKDRYFVVNVAPVSGELIAIKNNQSLEDKKVRAAVTVNIAYDINIFQLSTLPKLAVITKRNKKNLEIKNTGNTYAKIIQVSYCEDKSGANCTLSKIGSFGIYPGETKEISLTENKPVKMKIMKNESKSRIFIAE